MLLFRRRLVPLAVLGSLALGAAATGPAAASVVPRQALLEGTSWSEYDQTNTSVASLTLDRTHAGYSSAQSAKAVFNGGANGYSRGIYNVAWNDGDDVTYGAAFYLPVGFKNAMQGQVDLLRWDNWTVDPTNTDRSGIVVYGSDKKARIMRQKLGVEEVPLAAAFDIPEGRWFWIEVHQKLSKGAGALSEVFLDGVKVASSTMANTYGRGVTRVRSGIVAIDANRQTNPLTLWFDRSTVDTKVLGPAGTSPSTTTEPVAAPTTTSTVAKTPTSASASSTRDGLVASLAADSRSGTRWSSVSADNQWWKADLGRVRSVDEVQVDWETAFASKYAVETSTDGTTWTVAATQTATAAGSITTSFAARSARYVRVRGITRGTRWGLSIWEARILGAAD